ncbi:UNKNOWN [Stylonychia lemnae]|uniref:Uncharacterized protein n=1 Tax=Stylonychia lemnae TaxID=5949 RepID=A0A078AR31_STYLE|nr:UNKNOWN [Stylonychia lemnae]|eukprot:CDW84421.1 UNKNOWN [Stylonychia lemnae]
MMFQNIEIKSVQIRNFDDAPRKSGRGSQRGSRYTRDNTKSPFNLRSHLECNDSVTLRNKNKEESKELFEVKYDKLHEVLGFVQIEFLKLSAFKVKKLPPEDFKITIEGLEIYLRQQLNKDIIFENHDILERELQKFRVLGPHQYSNMYEYRLLDENQLTNQINRRRKHFIVGRSDFSNGSYMLRIFTKNTILSNLKECIDRYFRRYPVCNYQVTTSSVYYYGQKYHAVESKTEYKSFLDKSRQRRPLSHRGSDRTMKSYRTEVHSYGRERINRGFSDSKRNDQRSNHSSKNVRYSDYKSRNSKISKRKGLEGSLNSSHCYDISSESSKNKHSNGFKSQKSDKLMKPDNSPTTQKSIPKMEERILTQRNSQGQRMSMNITSGKRTNNLRRLIEQSIVEEEQCEIYSQMIFPESQSKRRFQKKVVSFLDRVPNDDQQSIREKENHYSGSQSFMNPSQCDIQSNKSRQSKNSGRGILRLPRDFASQYEKFDRSPDSQIIKRQKQIEVYDNYSPRRDCKTIFDHLDNQWERQK